MNSNQVASTSANKASQRDQKTAASLWFFGPCWRRYGSLAMNKFFTILMILHLASFLTGCGFLMNMTYDQHEYFKELRNSEVGKDIEEPLSKIPDSWQSSFLKVVEVDSQNIEYRFTYSKCSWVSNVDSETNLIKSWRFISAPEECKSLKYYQGPW